MEPDQHQLEYLPPSLLKANPLSARTHSKQQIRQIAASIREFRFTNPVLVYKDNVIVAGHGRWEAARLIGLPTIPVLRLEYLSPDQIRAYVIADNRLAEQAGWDRSILAIELQHLTVSAELDVTITGFDIPEIDLLIGEAKEGPPVEEPVPSPEVISVSRPGDLWLALSHRILCADSLSAASYERVLDGGRARMVFADPPYNVPIDGHVSGKGAIHHREFAMGVGEMTSPQFTRFLANGMELWVRHSTKGALHFVCMDWRHLLEVLNAGEGIYPKLENLCVWAKNNAGMGSFYRSQHELVFVFKNGTTSARNNVQLGRFGRNRSNLWPYPNAATLSRTGDEGNLLALHPTIKPVALVADAILDCTARGDPVLDPFLGSGSTLIAAEQVGRACRGIEIDPLYVDVAIRRWQHRTGEAAILAGTGERFEAVAERRKAEHG